MSCFSQTYNWSVILQAQYLHSRIGARSLLLIKKRAIHPRFRVEPRLYYTRIISGATVTNSAAPPAISSSGFRAASLYILLAPSRLFLRSFVLLFPLILCLRVAFFLPGQSPASAAPFPSATYFLSS